ncbi:hypothetical protein [Paraburkholderia sp.]|jgi:regulator of protease activity HflC (stomatin/prohibitin superfamily)|uniref:hypothetical protein n=1 Tax=Paraburkholderia sp. TaxID=1926495 RepID=UPI002F3E33BE
MNQSVSRIAVALIAGCLSAVAFAQTDSGSTEPTHADKKAAKEQAKANKKADVAQAKADKSKTDAQADADKAAADAKEKDARKE